MTGYKKMISDRIPQVWDMAIRWCKCRQRWIDRVYDCHLRQLNTDCMHSKEYNNRRKSGIVKRILDPKTSSFKVAIDYDKMLTYSHEDYDYWASVVSWEAYFRKKNIYWKNFVELRSDMAKPQIAKELSETHHIDIGLATFVVNTHRPCD